MIDREWKTPDVASGVILPDCRIFTIPLELVDEIKFETVDIPFPEHPLANSDQILAHLRKARVKRTAFQKRNIVDKLSLKPLIDAGLLDLNQWPVINATSGVSGAGRKAAISNSFCEVSLQPYGVFTHRHQPEIATHLGADVIFTPHLGNFPRGILETITCRLKPGVSQVQVAQALQQAYAHKPLVRLYDKGVPALKNVVGLPFCDIGFAVQGEHLIIVATEDNLLKGAAAQAVQCANIRFGYAETQSLI